MHWNLRFEFISSLWSACFPVSCIKNCNHAMELIDNTSRTLQMCLELLCPFGLTISHQPKPLATFLLTGAMYL